jgi:TPP-dependent pyruvate/acetoin dehydrogenase alpha subunit
MHIADPETGNLGANAIVAGSAGIATGAALSARQRGTDRVAVCFFGEGALGQGVLYEVMNMASLWQLPVIYVCENNLYNEYTHYLETTAGKVAARAESFGIPAETIDGQDVLGVRGAASRAVERARAGDGPTFLECRTYRFFGHHVGDVDRSYYRSKQEEEQWRSSRDPIQLLREWMREHGYADDAELGRIDERVAVEVEEGERFAIAAAYPDASEVDRHVYP